MPEILPMLTVAVAAAGLGMLGKPALSALPEPRDPDTGERDPSKSLYADLARTVGLPWWLAAGAAAYAILATALLDEFAFVGVWVFIGAFGVLLAFVDARTHLLPRLLVWPLYALTWIATIAAAVLLREASVLRDALYGNLIVFGIFVLLYVVAGRFFGGGFGYGDVRLSAVLGVALGPHGVTATFAGIYAGFVLAAIVGIIRNRGRVRGQPHLAFGPYMVLGALAGLTL